MCTYTERVVQQLLAADTQRFKRQKVTRHRQSQHLGRQDVHVEQPVHTLRHTGDAKSVRSTGHGERRRGCCPRRLRRARQLGDYGDGGAADDAAPLHDNLLHYKRLFGGGDEGEDAVSVAVPDDVDGRADVDDADVPNTVHAQRQRHDAQRQRTRRRGLQSRCYRRLDTVAAADGGGWCKTGGGKGQQLLHIKSSTD